MKAPVRVGLPPNLKALFIERYPLVEVPNKEQPIYALEVQTHEEGGYWLLPLSTNPQRTLGIFLKLYDNGKVTRLTCRDDQADEEVLIKPEDGKEG
jgi:hypothetical protein